jgi:uncharacterized protein
LSVRVLEVDLVRKRIALSAKRGSDSAHVPGAGPRPQQTSGGRPDQNRGQRPPNAGRAPQGKPQPTAQGFSNNPFAAHFRK